MTREQSLISYRAQLRLALKDSHNVDERRELRAEIAQITAEIEALSDKRIIEKLGAYTRAQPIVNN